MKSRVLRIWQRLRDESGANQLVILAVVLGALLFVPVIFDFASVRYARRTAQTGADAAVMAAAKDYAIALSITWSGFCAEPPPSVVGRYLVQHVQPIQWSPMGRVTASGYAAANRSRLTQYRNYPNGRFKTVATIPLPYLDVYGATRKDVNTMIEYGRAFQTPARATSTVFLERADHWTVPCTYAGEPNVLHVYRFHWKIRLVN